MLLLGSLISLVVIGQLFGTMLSYRVARVRLYRPSRERDAIEMELRRRTAIRH